MIKSLSKLFLLCMAFILNSSSYASEDHLFDYQVNRNNKIAFQVFKNAPLPPESLHTQDFYEKEGFQKVSAEVTIDSNKFEATYFGGWVFMAINKENDSCVSPMITTFEKFRNGEQPDVLVFAKIAKDLRGKSESANLRNPYAGKSLLASYSSGDGVPVEGELIPTCTYVDNTDRLPKSLAVVYGGTLKLNDKSQWHFHHGEATVFSYSNASMSSYSPYSYVKGNFRYTDDGKTANQKLEITSFPSWF